MLDLPQQATAAPAGIDRRVFGLAPAAVALLIAGLTVTVAIALLQIQLRQGVFDPTWLPIFPRLFAIEDYPASFLFIVVLMLAAIPAVQSQALNLVRAMGEHPVAVATTTTVVLAAGCLWASHAQPLAMDEVAPYLQAQIFTHGDLFGKLPSALIDWLVYKPFQNYFIHVSHDTGEIASSYWPGFALILTPFMAAGVPWLCNPVLGGLSLWVTHRLTLRLTGSTEAAGAALLFAVASAAFMVNAMTFYSMSAHLLCNAVFVLLLLDPTPKRAFIAGLIGGLALTLHNPIPHMTFALPWLVWLLTRKDRWQLIAAISAGYLPWIIVVGFGWNALLHTLADVGSRPSAAAHLSPLDEAVHRFTSLMKLPGNKQLMDRVIGVSKLWLWASPLLVLMAGIGFARHRMSTPFRLLLASCVVTFAVYLFVPLDQGHGWGFRYVHSVWFVLPVFAAAALVPDKRSPLNRMALGAALCSLFVMLPYFTWQVHQFSGSHLSQVPEATHGTARMVFVNVEDGYYSQDLVYNDPYLREGPIRLVSRGRKADAELMATQFPNLVLLQRDRRGSVWGTPEPAP